MNKKELVESVSVERNLTKKEAELLVDTVFKDVYKRQVYILLSLFVRLFIFI